MSNRKLVTDMFNNNKSAYAIHVNTGLGIKEVYNYIKENETAKHRHKKALREQRELENR